jgi:hypothetical protein
MPSRTQDGATEERPLNAEVGRLASRRADGSTQLERRTCGVRLARSLIQDHLHADRPVSNPEPTSTEVLYADRHINRCLTLNPVDFQFSLDPIRGQPADDKAHPGLAQLASRGSCRCRRPRDASTTTRARPRSNEEHRSLSLRPSCRTPL